MPYSYFLNDYMQIHDRLIDLVDEDQLGGPYLMPAEVDQALPAEPQQVPRTKRTFLFCNFNQHYKMDPTSFKVWMGALRRTPRSKLWTLQFPTDTGSVNLAAEGAAAGLGPSRIVSTALLPQDTHLSGKASAHLYLDTFVYNGHTTAADALWAGVPMLTLPGAKQIGRTAAGFAVALGCNDMVAASVKEFEDEACVYQPLFLLISAKFVPYRCRVHVHRRQTCRRRSVAAVCSDLVDFVWIIAFASRVPSAGRLGTALLRMAALLQLLVRVRRLEESSGMH